MSPTVRQLLLTAVAGFGLGARAEDAAPESVEYTRRTATTDDAQVGEGYIRFPVHGFKNTVQGVNILRARQKEVSVENLQDGTIYSIALGLGTPPQQVEVIIDTGSSELWVNPDCATTASRRFCTQFPRYNWQQSDTFRDTGASGFIQYGKGNVTLAYVADSVTFGSSTTITNQIFGVATASSDIPMGILGLGPKISSRAVNYSYVLDTLASQGQIKSRAFSLDLRSVDNPNGAVIFGGLDTSKYIGSLQKCPILNAANTPRGADRYYIYMTSISVTQPGGSSTSAFTAQANTLGQPVFLDSGGTLTRLPPDMFRAIGQNFPTAIYDSRSGFYIVSCTVANQAGTVDFGFGGGGKVIRVSYADFIWRASATTCVLGVLPEDRGEPVLGASFLRAAYVVYDQDNRNLHLAQAANCGSSIVSIGSGADAVPSSTGKCTATGGSGTSARPTATGAGGEGCTNCDGGGVVTVTVAPTASTSAPPGGSAAGRLRVDPLLVLASTLGLLVAWSL